MPKELLRALSSFPCERGGQLNHSNSLLNLFASGELLGFAVAEKLTDGDRTGELALRLYVKRKKPRSGLRYDDWLPRALNWKPAGRKVTPVRTDIVEMARLPVAHSDLGPRILEAGDSISSWLGETGTFGLHVQNSAGASYALTCAHVVAPPWNKHPAGQGVDSPAVDVQNAGQEAFGKVESWSILDPTIYNTVDAALIRADGSIQLRNDSLTLGATPSFVDSFDTFLKANPSAAIEIHSRRGIVKGNLDAIENQHPVNFGTTQTFYFSRIVSYTAPVRAGDSGSVVIDTASRKVLGLHFAGDDGTNRGYCIPFQNILSLYKDSQLTIGA